MCWQKKTNCTCLINNTKVLVQQTIDVANDESLEAALAVAGHENAFLDVVGGDKNQGRFLGSGWNVKLWLSMHHYQNTVFPPTSVGNVLVVAVGVLYKG